MHPSRRIPYLLCAALIAALAISMAASAAKLDAQKTISDARCQAKEEVIESLAVALWEQQEQNAELSRTISELQSQIEDMRFRPDPDIPLSGDLQEHAWNLCRQNGIEYDVFMMLMWRESRYQVDALNYNKNGTYDRSLMQINDVNKGWLAAHYGLDTSDPYDSIEAAVVLLRYFLNKGYTMEQSLACYGAGERGAMELGRGFEAARKLIERAETLCI